MSEGRRRRRLGSLWRICAAALATVLLGGWAGLRHWYPVHLEEVTGRAGLPRVSCLRCHRAVAEPPVRGSPANPAYISPAGLAVSPDGGRLYVAAEGADRLLEVDLAARRVRRAVAVPGRPHGVAISADGQRLAVSTRDRDVVVILDARTLAVTRAVRVGAEPLGLALSPDGSRVYVACGGSDDLWVVDLEGSAAVPLVAGEEPYAVSLAGDGGLLAVANRRAAPAPPRTVPVSEVTLVDARRGRIRDRRPLRSAHLSEGVALSSDGSFALATVIRVRNLLPTTQVSRGALMNSALAFIETAGARRTVQFPLDEVNAYFADPSGVVLTPDDRLAFVAHGGSRVVTAVDVAALRELVARGEAAGLEALADDLGVSSRYVLARIPTLDNPRALAISPDGRWLYVAERLADSVAIIDTGRLELEGRIDLGGPRVLTAERRGERIFTDASFAFQGQFSCRSCHPDGHSDGLVWDFEIDGVGANLVETRSLRGIRDTSPFTWNGKNPDLPTQCGPRFARVLTRSDPIPEGMLRDLVAFIESIPRPPPRLPGELAAARERGRRIFYRTRTNSGAPIPVGQRCHTCHPPPLYTDRLPADVGTGGTFDTPHLFDVASTAPYLHDGRARTLEEIWTIHNPDDAHGVTSDLTKVELNDLVVFLRSL